MSTDISHCLNTVTCPGGNCSGCKNGQLNCSDPACEPYCQGCEMLKGHDQAVNFTFLILILGLALLIIILMTAFGPKLIKTV